MLKLNTAQLRRSLTLETCVNLLQSWTSWLQGREGNPSLASINCMLTIMPVHWVELLVNLALKNLCCENKWLVSQPEYNKAINSEHQRPCFLGGFEAIVWASLLMWKSCWPSSLRHDHLIINFCCVKNVLENRQLWSEKQCSPNISCRCHFLPAGPRTMLPVLF